MADQGAGRPGHLDHWLLQVAPQPQDPDASEYTNCDGSEAGWREDPFQDCAKVYHQVTSARALDCHGRIN